MSDSKPVFPTRAALERAGPAALLALAAAAAQAADPVQCLIGPAQLVTLRSSVPAQIVAMHADRGAAVQKGQLLVTLDASVEKASLAIARYRAVMLGQQRAAESKLVNAQVKFRRREELQLQKFVSAQDRDDAEAEMRVAEADLLEAKDNRELSRLDAQRLEAEIGRRMLASPVTGVVIERLQNPGELAQVGEGTIAIIKVAQTDPARVEMVLPAARFGKLKVGQQIRIKTEPPFDKSFQAVVKVVDPLIDAASGTFGVRLEAANPKQEIPLGVKCSAEL
ncbi:efflux RND transporter periplasmic adaptor subunit [Ramlibacter sp. G-1-2-2]|uniref:Efflux RND transporter periplasmic adaptor subunit n=1 Tax=Ramlibacter agri TaxID=2728837 RepID=A0A848H8Y8_9BURK|nr:efflux RND transporter periplasmic adaptor subunit [Ramlibacter agri]NML45870.1 efflux RND transporter periplasmic adaptor subunit [Ramlibacter agri]